MLYPLLSLLSPTESSPHLVLAALRALNAVADSTLLRYPSHDESHEGLLSLLYTDRHLAVISQLLQQNSRSSTVQLQIALTAALIGKTCHEEHQRALLAQAGILEALAVRLASFVVATGCALISNNHYDQPFLAPSSRKMAPIFKAISAIIQHSKSRAVQFLSAPAFASVFQKLESDTKAYESRGRDRDHAISDKFTPRQTSPNFINYLLPSLPSPHCRGSPAQTSNFPTLGMRNSSGRHLHSSRSFSSAIEVIQNQGLEFIEEEESPLIGWLLYIARTDDEVTGLTAAWVLAILYRQGLTKRGKEGALALSLIPVLSRMLDKDLKVSSDATHADDTGISTSPEDFVKEKAPLVLAMLAAHSSEVEKAAADAGVIKKLSQLLKESYNEIPLSSSALMWTPETLTSEHMEIRDDTSRLGPDGLSPMAYHFMSVRESVLVALAAIASDNDEYRKAIIDNGVIPFVVKTLKPAEDGLSLAAQNNALTEGPAFTAPRPLLGNPKDAILAACGAARALSRSVSILRTSLMDAGLAAPLFVLLRHQDMDLQIAATAVVCNLVLQFSPMQEVCN